MTTYPRVTCGCPITRRCLRYLHDHVKPGVFAFENEVDLVEDLIVRGNTISDHPDLVKLRGFIAIQAMLDIIVQIYEERYRRPTDDRLYLQLSERSWIELTHLKIALEVLLDQVNIDLTEMKLGGTTFKGSTARMAQGESAAAGLRGLTAQRLKPMAESLIESINAFRPYLKNEQAHVGSVGDRLILVFALGYGLMLPLIETTKKLVEAQL